MKAKIIVRLKSTVHDPQGEAIYQSVHHMNYNEVQSVRQGKVFDIDLGATARADADRVLHELARRILANPIIEEYSIELGEQNED